MKFCYLLLNSNLHCPRVVTRILRVTNSLEKCHSQRIANKVHIYQIFLNCV